MVETRWSKEGLYNLVEAELGDSLFIVVSNREPYVHSYTQETDRRIRVTQPVGGLTEALDPVMRAAGGTWVAWGSGDADFDEKIVDKDQRVMVPPPPEESRYALKRVKLTEADVAGFYLGFANESLWPLCHVTFTPPNYREDWWHTYRTVNRTFADSVLQEIGDRKAVVLVQDYHFALLSHYIKESKPDLTVGQFWHIPWPDYDFFRTCPWNEEIINGMLGNDLMGFHIQDFCNSFLDNAARILGADIDRENGIITYRGNMTEVRPFPISVDFDSLNAQAGTEEVEKEMENLREELDLNGKYLGVGMDRMDYTKGIPERLMALDKFFEDNPEYCGKVVFVQAGMPSRTQIDTYKQIDKRINDLMNGLNEKYGTGSWKPVVAMTRQLSPVTLHALRRLANFCVVSSLHDGMNLVAKEYVASRIDGDGVLILSRFTGSAVEMKDSLLINPYDISDFAVRIKEAVEMPQSERRRRMKKMRATVSENNIYKWAGTMVSRLMEITGK